MYGKVYVAGKITGLTEEEFKRNFMQGVGKVHALGVPLRSIVNPAVYTIDGGNWRDYMRLCLSRLMECDTIYMLEGWKSSQGAKFELLTAQTLGLEVLYENEEMEEI